MGAGVASLGTFQKMEAGGPPFPATAANNGLSVDAGTGKIVLGNNVGAALATLLSNREIPVSNFWLNFITPDALPLFQIDGSILRVNSSSFDPLAVSGGVGVQASWGQNDINFWNFSASDVNETFLNRFFSTVSEMRLEQSGIMTITADKGGQVGVNDVPVVGMQAVDSTGTNVGKVQVDYIGRSTLPTQDRISTIHAYRNFQVTHKDDLQLNEQRAFDITYGAAYAMVAKTGDIDARANGTILTVDDVNQLVTSNRQFRAISTGNQYAMLVDAEDSNIKIRNKAATQDIGTIGRDSSAGLSISAFLADITLDPAGGFDVRQTRGYFRFPGTAGNTLRWGASTSAPATNAGPVFTNYYGGNTNALGDPVGWVLINIAGTDRKIPFF